MTNYFDILNESIEESRLFNLKRNVPDLYKHFFRYKNRNLIYYMNYFKPDTEFNGETSLENLESLDTFVDKLIKDNDFITYVAKSKEKILALFDAEQKLPFIFGILFVDGECDSCGSIVESQNMSLFTHTI